MKYLCAAFSILICFLLNISFTNAQVDVSTGGPVTTYPNLKLAFDAINGGTHTGNILIEITGQGVYLDPGAASVINSSGAGSADYSSILIRPSADSVSIYATTSGGRGVIELNGADNVTIDGDNPNTPGINRNLSIINTSASTSTYTSCFRIVLSSLISSGNNNVIKNCIINGSAKGRNVSSATSTAGSENTTFGILIGGGASTVSVTNPPSPVSSVSATIGSGITAVDFISDNNQINSCARGIAVMGSAITVADSLKITNNIFGSSVSGDSSTVYSRGITIQGYNNAEVSGNRIQNMQWFVATAQIAIGLGNEFANGANAVIEKNVVDGVNNRSTGTFGAYGINLNAGSNNIVRNNSITGITGDMSGGVAFSTSFGIFGIRISVGNGHKIYNNSVNLFGTRTGTPSTSLLSSCFAITSSSLTGIDVRNNVFSNTMSGGTSSISYVSIYLPAGAGSSMNLTLNNNAYFSDSLFSYQGLAQVGLSAGTGFYFAGNFNPGTITPSTNFRAYSNALRSTSGNDSLSFASSQAAPFVSITDLHITSCSITKLESGAASVGIITDIDGDNRPGPAGSNCGGAYFPDIGFDEFDGAPVTNFPPFNDAGAISIETSLLPNQILAVGNSVSLKVILKNFGFNPQTNIPVYYSVNAGPPSGPVNSTDTIATDEEDSVAFTGGLEFTPQSSGTYTIKAFTSLPSDTSYDNDTAVIFLHAYSSLSANPYFENFSSHTDWTIVVEDSTGSIPLWKIDTCTNPDGKVNDSAVSSDCFGSSSGRKEILRSPLLNLNGMPNPFLEFSSSYRSNTNDEDDSLEVLVSTDAGASFFSASTIFNKSNNSVPSLATRPPSSLDFYPDSSNQWRREMISLSNVAGMNNVMIGFRSKCAHGNRQWIDNVVIMNTDSVCEQNVSSPGIYSCSDSLLKITMNTTGNPSGGALTIALTKDQNPVASLADTIIRNNSTAITNDSSIFTPNHIYTDKWFRTSYTGNDKSGFANYDVTISLSGFTINQDINQLYIVARTTRWDKWTCLNTTLVNGNLSTAGLNDFREFAVAGDTTKIAAEFFQIIGNFSNELTNFGKLKYIFKTSDVQRYLNLSINAQGISTQWQIQNALLPSSDSTFFDTIYFAFEISSGGAEVNNLQYSINVSADTAVAPIPFINSHVAQTNEVIRLGADSTEVNSSKPPPAPFKGFAINEKKTVLLDRRNTVNASCGLYESIPAAVHNSLTSLHNFGNFPGLDKGKISIEALKQPLGFDTTIKGAPFPDCYTGSDTLQGEKNYMKGLGFPLNNKILNWDENDPVAAQEIMQRIFTNIASNHGIELFVEKKEMNADGNLNVYRQIYFVTGISNDKNDSTLWQLFTSDDCNQSGDDLGTQNGPSIIDTKIPASPVKGGIMHNVSKILNVIIESQSENTSSMQLDSPPDNSSGQSLTPHIQAHLNGTLRGMKYSYSLQISKDSAFTWDSLVINIDTLIFPEYDVPASILESGKKYFWRMSADNDSLGDGHFSSAYNFTTSSQKFISVKVIPEGFFINEGLIREDTLRINLRAFNSPYNILDSITTIIDTADFESETMSISISNNDPVWIEVLDERCISTWSADTVSMTGDTVRYDFTSDSSQTFGNNVKLMNPSPLLFGIYSGDVVRDGNVDLTDIVSVYNYAQAFVKGYVIADLNGDAVVDLTDLTIVFNNSAAFVTVMKP